LLTSPQTLNAAREEWQQTTKVMKYFSLVPADAKPDVNMNREMDAEISTANDQVLSQ
jgi:hypothetical protein